jgi:hypothetical protein
VLTEARIGGRFQSFDANVTGLSGEGETAPPPLTTSSSWAQDMDITKLIDKDLMSTAPAMEGRQR